LAVVVVVPSVPAVVVVPSVAVIVVTPAASVEMTTPSAPVVVVDPSACFATVLPSALVHELASTTGVGMGVACTWISGVGVGTAVYTGMGLGVGVAGMPSTESFLYSYSYHRSCIASTVAGHSLGPTRDQHRSSSHSQ
jgi:hypothetical protein